MIKESKLKVNETEIKTFEIYSSQAYKSLKKQLYLSNQNPHIVKIRQVQNKTVQQYRPKTSIQKWKPNKTIKFLLKNLDAMIELC